MQSEAVSFDGKAFTHGKRGTDTEFGRTLLPMRGFFPGNSTKKMKEEELTVEEIFMKAFHKTANKKDNQLHTEIKPQAQFKTIYRWFRGAFLILVHLRNIYLACRVIMSRLKLNNFFSRKKKDM